MPDPGGIVVQHRGAAEAPAFAEGFYVISMSDGSTIAGPLTEAEAEARILSPHLIPLSQRVFNRR